MTRAQDCERNRHSACDDNTCLCLCHADDDTLCAWLGEALQAFATHDTPREL